MKLLTVTVPCYNSQAFMENCIDSLLAGGDRVEILIVNDGSKDATGEIADAYAAKYPDMVRVIHQENGGHGEGINQGLRHATGTYFKVVDSDDRLSEDFPAFVDALEACEAEGGVDLLLTNYRYVHTDGVGDCSIGYKNVLKPGKITPWAQTKPFFLHQLITLHSGTFRTELMRRWKEPLPKHVSYEDNLMVFQTLPFVKKLYYIDRDLYRYTIGREGQSVARETMKKRYTHQLLVAEKCFCACDFEKITDKRQRKYMKHEMFMMFAIGICFARMNRNQESDNALEQMWETCIACNRKWGRYFRYGTVLSLLCLPGRFGRWFTNAVYDFANGVIRYN